MGYFGGEQELKFEGKVFPDKGASREEVMQMLADFDGYRQEFLQLFGFGVDGVDYDADVDPEVAIPQLVE